MCTHLLRMGSMNDMKVTVDEVVAAVRKNLYGCPQNRVRSQVAAASGSNWTGQQVQVMVGPMQSSPSSTVDIPITLIGTDGVVGGYTQNESPRNIRRLAGAGALATEPRAAEYSRPRERTR